VEGERWGEYLEGEVSSPFLSSFKELDHLQWGSIAADVM
jgi:hypothetical protein